MLENRYYGYDFRSRQPCIVVEVTLTIGQPGDASTVDTWLSEHLRIDIAQLVEDEGRRESRPASPAFAAANRALALYGELLRAAGIPSFDPGRVLRLAPLGEKPGSYRATIALPVVDRLPRDLFARLFRASLAVVLGRLTAEPTPAAVQDLFAHLDEEIISPAAKFSPFEATTLALCKLAHEHDTPWRHVGRGVVRLGAGARSRLLFRSSIEQDSAIGAQVCGSKLHTVLLLKSAGFPAPDHLMVDTAGAAAAAAAELGWPVVVKPEHEARSEGVTVNVRSEAQVRAAFAKAREKNEEVLIERQVPGVCHRIAVADGTIIYAVKRMAKGVTGDGASTVAQLVAAANAKLATRPPWQRLKAFPLDDLARECLAEEGLSPDSVLAEGRRVNLRPHSTDEWGGDVENLTDAIHPDNARLAIDAARLLGLAMAGVDLMTTDISRPWHENGAVIIEVNYMPQVELRRREGDVSTLLPRLLGSNGRIPVHLVTGEGDVLAAGRALKARLGGQGRTCHLTSAGHSEDAEGRDVVMPFATLFDRSLALTLRKDVEELVLAGDMAELFAGGLAVDRLTSVHILGGEAEAASRTASEINARFTVGSFHMVTHRR